VSRRAALQAGAVGLLGLGLGHLNELRALGAPSQPGRPRARSVVFVFLSGGLSHLDSLDPKPDAPDSVRGPFRPIATRTPGLWISEHLPLLAQRSQRWALCRALTTGTDDHELGHQVMLSGRMEPPPGFNPNQPQATDWPAMAALANYATRGRHNLPPAVVLPEKMIRTDNLRPRPGQFAGLLGPKWDPWFLEAAAWCHHGWGACPRCYDGRAGFQDGRVYSQHQQPLFQVPSLLLPEDVSPARWHDRVTLLATLDGQRRSLERSAEVGRYDHRQQNAVSLLTSGRTRGALFDVARADGKTLDRYGRNKFGWSMLLAGRLIEAGVSLVQVNLGKTSTWDLHEANFPILKDLLLPPTDRALSALLDDLEDKGLLQDTLIVLASEFGRTPRINRAARPGRDHWGSVQTVFFAGGGVQGGRVVGTSDKLGARPATDPQTPDNLAATIYQALGIPRSAVWHDSGERPHDFYTGEPVGALFG
jgi:hypothetical protein